MNGAAGNASENYRLVVLSFVKKRFPVKTTIRQFSDSLLVSCLLEKLVPVVRQFVSIAILAMTAL